MYLCLISDNIVLLSWLRRQICFLVQLRFVVFFFSSGRHAVSGLFVLPWFKQSLCQMYYMFFLVYFQDVPFAVLKPGFIVLFCVSLSHLLLYLFVSQDLLRFFLSFVPVFVFCIYLTWSNSCCIYLSRVKPWCMFCLYLIHILFIYLDLRHVVFFKFDLIHIVFVCLDVSHDIFMCLDLIHIVCIYPDSCQVVFLSWCK